MGGAVVGNGTWVGLDVHAKSVVAGLISDESGELRVVRAPHRTEELVRWVGELDSPVRVAYEAGPTGFGLARALAQDGIGCVVAAPSLIARSPAGRTRKNDAHDAEQLARLLRQGEPTPVRVPDPADEAARDLVRAREDARADLMRARHRLSKLLLCHGCVFEQGRAWTGAHDAWLRAQDLGHPAARAAFDDAYGAVLGAGIRRDTLDCEIAQMATEPRRADLVGRLGCLRGVGTLTAFALCVEIGDWHRLTGATIGAYLGLVPSESQSGARHTRGPITKAGNSHARRLLVGSRPDRSYVNWTIGNASFSCDRRVARRHLHCASHRIEANKLTPGPRGVLVCDEGAIDDIRQPALEGTYRLLAGVAGSNAALQVGNCVRMTARLGHRNAVESRVELAVAVSIRRTCCSIHAKITQTW